MAAATNTVFQPFGIVTGGFGGLGIIFDKLWSIPLWMTNVTLNVPLFILAFRYKTKKFMLRTICSDIMLTVFLGVLPRFSFFPKDFYVNLILGAILMGIGLGLVMKERTSTGGDGSDGVLTACCLSACKHSYASWDAGRHDRPVRRFYFRC